MEQNLSAADAAAAIAPMPDTYLRLADAMESNLRDHILSMWYPRDVDRERGGFIESFSEDWTPSSDENRARSLVYQSRLTWTAAQAARRYPEQAEEYAAYVRHGIAILRNRLWDEERGGFFWQADALTGEPTSWLGAEKHAYGIAFGIYAASAAYEATGDEDARELAQRAFLWLDERAHDGENGGYFEQLTRAGEPILSPPPSRRREMVGGMYGYKSMNSHIHLLEAFTALYEVWPDARVRERLDEVFHVVRDRIQVEPGCLNLFFTPGWRAVPDHDSFGHDVETAFLLVEASAALGKPDDTRTWQVARNLVDHALEYGWDETHGGFYDRGSAFGRAHGLEKHYWTQAEGLNALLLMHERHGQETPRYFEAFVRQWEFIARHQIDHRHGGWLTIVERTGAPIPGQKKSDPWKDPYHQGRALMRVTDILRRLAGRA